MADDDEGLGARFWLGLVGICILAVLGGMVVFFIIGAAWYAWGFLGAMLFFCVVALVWAWMVDRRQERRRAQLM
jgi:hypothetical protein